MTRAVKLIKKKPKFEVKVFASFALFFWIMTRGNQRELAREKNLKKQKTTKTKDELPLEKKKARDVAALKEKQKKPKGQVKDPKGTNKG
ncbi:putative SERF-like protein [Anthonomus grandis grandis]|uniref:putative SERF-like protein n=1 Tax=Anthonomus grandis grandis TaxID=2921223 RepID=UPI0021658175|nr:putative SERF-like protein [Anthonomus grandis grandis]